MAYGCVRTTPMCFKMAARAAARQLRTAYCTACIEVSFARNAATVGQVVIWRSLRAARVAPKVIVAAYCLRTAQLAAAVSVAHVRCTGHSQTGIAYCNASVCLPTRAGTMRKECIGCFAEFRSPSRLDEQSEEQRIRLFNDDADKAVGTLASAYVLLTSWCILSRQTWCLACLSPLCLGRGSDIINKRAPTIHKSYITTSKSITQQKVVHESRAFSFWARRLCNSLNSSVTVVPAFSSPLQKDPEKTSLWSVLSSIDILSRGYLVVDWKRQRAYG